MRLRDVIAALAALCLHGCVIRATEKDIFHPGTAPGIPPAPAPQDFFFEGDDGTPLNARFWPREDATATVLYYGGNAFYMNHATELVRTLREHPVNLFMMDYRGYGRSGGYPTAATLASDSLRAYDVLRERYGTPAERIMIHGQSMGSVTAVHVASARPVGALFLENPVSTTRAVVRNAIPWPLRPFVRVRVSEGLAELGNEAPIKTITAPTVIVGGSNDPTTPAWMARRLHRLSGASFKRLLIIDGGGHNGLFTEPEFQSIYAEILGQLRSKADSG